MTTVLAGKLQDGLFLIVHKEGHFADSYAMQPVRAGLLLAEIVPYGIAAGGGPYLRGQVVAHDLFSR